MNLSVHYATKDRVAFINSARFALKSCIILSGLAMLSLMFAADDISEIYFEPHGKAWAISKRLLWIFPSSLVPFIGSDAVWLSFPAAELVCLTIG